MRQIRMMIDNQKIVSSEGINFFVCNPAKGNRIASVAGASAEDVQKAVGAASKAFPGWSALSVEKRCEYLLRAAELIENYRQELAAAETEETGKPIYESENIDIPLSIKAFKYYGDHAPGILNGRQYIKMDDDRFQDYVTYEPYGVAGIIVPWNFPLHLLTRDMCPALAAGNTVVIKPSSKTPVTAAILGDILMEAGFPEGVINIIYGSGSVAGEELIRSKEVSLIAFTGSEEVGRRIMHASAQSAVIKKMVLELGGKGAFCVDKTANLEGAVSSAVYGVCMNQGEVCCAASRCYVHEAIYEEFVEKAVSRMQEIKLGDPMDRETDMGSLIDGEQLEKVDGFVKRAIQAGARLITGGRRNTEGSCSKGWFYEPTILTDVCEDMECMQKEIFGPVLMIVKVRDIQEAVERANRSDYGLGAAIWSEDEEALEWASHELQAGTVWLNHNITSTLEAPYGGIKNSGFGRQYSTQGLLEYVYIKNHMQYQAKPYFDFYREKRKNQDL